MEWIVLLSIGLAAGTIGSLIGLGGGVIIVPALLFFSTYTGYLQTISPQVAVGTSLIIMIFTGLSSTLAYLKHKMVDYKSGLIFFLGSGPGGIVGAWINQTLDMRTFNIFFGAFMIFVSLLLLVNHKLKPMPLKAENGIHRTFIDNEGRTWEYGFQPVIAIFIAFIVGLSSGLFGIGGGSLMVPAMLLLFLFPPHVAVATSMFMIFLSSIVSSTTHISLGHINWQYAFLLIPGAWFGAKLGAFINMKLASKTVVHILRLILILVGFRLIYQGFTG